MNNWKIWTIAITGAALAWLLLALSPTEPPLLTSPDTGIQIRGHVPVTAITLQWNHGGRKLTSIRPRPANYFVICVDDRAVLDDGCGTGTSVNFIKDWRRPGDISRTSLSGGPITWLDGPFAYRYDIELPEAALGLQLHWTVGACRTQNDLQSCAFATPRTLIANATDIHTVQVDSQTSTGSLTIAVDLENTGEEEVGAGSYTLATSVWEIIASPANCAQPLTDVSLLDNPATPADDSINFQVLTRDGTLDSVHNLPLDASGGRDTSNVRAIIRKGANRIMRHWSYQPGVAADTTGSVAVPTLSPGTLPARIKPCPAADRPAGSSGDCTIQVPPDAEFEPRLFAAATAFDPQNLINEFDESNNSALTTHPRLFAGDDISVCNVNLYEN